MGGRALGLLAVLLLATLAGCASAPRDPPAQPVSVVPPQPGDTLGRIVERGYQVIVAYQFRFDGHGYAFANAYANRLTYDLVIIDGQLACGEPRVIENVTDWEWVGEADGLAYLAGRLRQACGLEASTPPRPLPALAAAEDVQPVGQSAGGKTEDFFEDHPVAGTLAGAVVMSVWLVYGPLLWIPGLLVEAAMDSPAGPSVEPARARVREFGLSVTADDVVEQFGRPQVTFELPRADTTVVGYGVDQSRSIYIGFADGRAIWIHGYHPWLNDLAKQALAEKKQGK